MRQMATTKPVEIRVRDLGLTASRGAGVGFHFPSENPGLLMRTLGQIYMNRNKYVHGDQSICCVTEWSNLPSTRESLAGALPTETENGVVIQLN